jgi:restriction endonuclease S subunit
MRKVKLKDIADVFSGLSYRRYLDDEGIKYKVVVQRSIQADGQLCDFEELKLKENIKERFFSKPGDVLMKMPYPFDVVRVNTPGLVISDRIAIIRVNTEYDDPSFIAHLLTNAHVKKQLHEIGSTERISHVSIKEIKELELHLPGAEDQLKYGILLNTINEKIVQDKKVVEYDRRLKEGILNKIWGDCE